VVKKDQTKLELISPKMIHSMTCDGIEMDLIYQVDVCSLSPLVPPLCSNSL